MKAEKVFHKWTIRRLSSARFWKGQFICRVFGHRIPRDFANPWCGRCGLALEEIYGGGLAFYEIYKGRGNY
ncbi:MAG TPA: hypothetical protein ENI23_11725 [bacterium]|nr:hypothetical protein [bacterium]